jgi:hypothetical protein
VWLAALSLPPFSLKILDRVVDVAAAFILLLLIVANACAVSGNH